MVRTALLDIDGTLTDGDSLWSCLIRQLLDDGLGGEGPLRRCLTDLETPGVSGMEAVHRWIPEALEQVTQVSLEKAADRAWKRVTLMPFARPLAAMLRRSSMGVVLVSGAPQALADRVGEIFAADAVYACIVRTGSRTGFSQFIGTPQAKTATIRHEAIGRGDDLTSAVAMGNGYNDIGMLSQVGFPVAFEPTSRLRQAAEQNDWPITCRDTVLQHVNTLLDLE